MITSATGSAISPREPSRATGGILRHRLLWLFVALALVRGLLFMAIIPPWQNPDEPYHFLAAHLPLYSPTDADEATLDALKRGVVRSLLEFHFWERVNGLPSITTEAEITPENLPRGFLFSAGERPRSYVYYALAPWFYPVTAWDATAQLFWGRLLSVLLLPVVVAMAYWLARLMYGTDPFATTLVPLIVLLHPHHTALFAGINDGIPAELLASATICVWLAGVCRGWSRSKVLAMVVLTLLSVLAKASNLFLVLAIPVWLLVRWNRSLMRGRNLAIVTLVGVLLAAAAFASRYVVLSYLAGLWRLLVDVSQGVSLENRVLPSIEGLYATFRNFWTVLGWNTLQMGWGWGELWLGMCTLAVVGVIVWGARRLRCLRRPERRDDIRPSAVVVLVICVLAAVATSLGFVVATGVAGSQGRYLFSALLPIAGLLTLGWRQWVPVGWRREALALAASGLFLFDAVALFLYVIPFFYPLWP